MDLTPIKKTCTGSRLAGFNSLVGDSKPLALVDLFSCVTL